MSGPGGPGAPVTPSPVGPFTCKQDQGPAPAGESDGWRRLGSTQYRNTLRDLLAFALRDSDAADATMGTLESELDRLPADERKRVPQDLHGSYRRLDQDVGQVHVEVAYGAAVAAAAALTTPARIGAVVGTCATDGNAANDGTCLDDFIRRFGERALRRPLAPEEVASYRALYGATPGADPAGYADVIAGLLTAPQFLYHVEHGDAAVPGKPSTFALGPFELASRLAYHFWDTMPDELLLDAAKSGALATPEGYKKQVERLFGDGRSRATIEGFLRDYLKLDDLAQLDARNSNPQFKAFAGPDLPKGSLRGEMIEDVLGLVRYYIWTKPSSFEELLTSELSFARGADLARLYGVPTWDGMAPPAAFPAGQRPGLFTRAAFLATGSANTRPVMKGVFLRNNVLCDEIPAPPNNAAAAAAELDDTLSTRQVIERITEAPDTACAACHKGMINPLGFATESFDALGRVRTQQTLFDVNGKELGKAVVNTRTVPEVLPGDMSESSGPVDLMRLMAASGKAQACFARHYFRFTFGRWEDPTLDGCVLEQIRQALARKAPLAEVLREVALTPEFKQRTIR